VSVIYLSIFRYGRRRDTGELWTVVRIGARR